MTIEKCNKSQENKKEKLRFISYQPAISIYFIDSSPQHPKWDTIAHKRMDVSVVVNVVARKASRLHYRE